MPTKPKRPRSVPGSPPASPLVEAHAEVLTQFDRTVADSLGPLLGKAGLARVRRDLAITTRIGEGVVVHAGMERKGVMTLERIAKEKPVVGVLANSIPLIDPISLTALEPGAYAVRIRPLGQRAMAFDFFDEKTRPAFSTIAEPTRPVPEERQAPIHGLIDVDLDFPWDPDSLSPPTGDTRGLLCLSFLIWKHCWHWEWPDIRWPW